MIVTKMALPRRTFLRGAGVALALPLLDAMVPALTAASKTAAAARAYRAISITTAISPLTASTAVTPRVVPTV